MPSRRCIRCIYGDDIPSITFDEQGVCSFCHTHDVMEREYPMHAEGERQLHALVDTIKRAGRGKKYDVVVGVSGGCDSSYMLHLAKVVLGLRPLAVHFDNTWNSTTAVENIHNILKVLDIDLYTYVVDNEEYDDIYRSFFRAGLPDVEAPTDIGLATVLYMAAKKYGIGYVFEGHSFRTEGISPLGWLYMDGGYIGDVHRKYGTMPMKTYPNLWISKFIWYTLVTGLKKIRPLYWIDYRKADAMKLLTEKYGWKWYGGHHLENRFTSFYHTFFVPRRIGLDGRLLGYSALIRSGQMLREDGLALIEKPQEFDPELVEMVKKRLGFSGEEFERLMTLPLRTFREFKTYKRLFERTKLFWWMLYKMDRVPKSFYTKYTAPLK